MPLARGLRAPRAAGVAGLLFSALFLTSILLLRHHPRSGAGAAELRAFYVEGTGSTSIWSGSTWPVRRHRLYLVPRGGAEPHRPSDRSILRHRLPRQRCVVRRDDVHRRSGGGCVLRGDQIPGRKRSDHGGGGSHACSCLLTAVYVRGQSRRSVHDRHLDDRLSGEGTTALGSSTSAGCSPPFCSSVSPSTR